MKYYKQGEDYLCYSGEDSGEYLGRIRFYNKEWKFYPDSTAFLNYTQLRQLYNKVYLLQRKVKV